MPDRWIYNFSRGKADGDASMHELLGSKGANLAQMCKLDFDVPPGFTITTEVCREYFRNDKKLPDRLRTELFPAIKQIENKVGTKFVDRHRPLLLSVRSGASVSMPGMLDTVLNIGLCKDTVEGLAWMFGSRRFAFNTWQRFIRAYSEVVLGIDACHFDDALADYMQQDEAVDDPEWTVRQQRELIERYLHEIKEFSGSDFPQDPYEQLWQAIGAVFGSWDNRRASDYRHLHTINADMGTAVTVQAMVFGNLGSTSASGVVFTRNPSTGEDRLFGEYLPGSQGDDLVSGSKTPCRLDKMRADMPATHSVLARQCKQLERYFRDMLDVEFTLERGKLWLLQARVGKRSDKAAIKIAMDMVKQDIISHAEAAERIPENAIRRLLCTKLPENHNHTVIATGLPASPGVASGQVVFDSLTAEKYVREGKRVILARKITSTDDIAGIAVAEGLLTSRGGMTSHAATIALGMGKPCVCGATDLRLDGEEKSLSQGDTITIDGASGQVLAGAVSPLKQPIPEELEAIMKHFPRPDN
jgi:pyruvate,orthophosphate dikinase